MSSFLRRLPLVGGATVAVLGLTAGTAMACTPYEPGYAQSQSAYSQTVTKIGKTLANAEIGTVAMKAAPAGQRPTVVRFNSTLTRNPDGNGAAAFTSPADDCAMPVCREIKINVPKDETSTLYARAAWPSATQYVNIWAVNPRNQLVGRTKVDDQVDKSTGNTDVTPLSEFTVHHPTPGIWRIQVRAVFGVNIPVKTSIALTKSETLQLPQLDVDQLADHYLTQKITYNVVMVNRAWAPDEVAAFKSAMPTEYRSSVLEKQFDDGCTNGNDSTVQQQYSQTLLNWGRSYYCGTAGKGATGTKPYHEPLSFRINYRFLQASKAYTEDLFAVMKKNTKYDQPFSLTGATGNRRQTQAQYLAQYNSMDGSVNRDAAHAVVNPQVGDKIDAFAVEDWVFAHRGDAKYAAAFKDVSTGKYVSARFINPDPTAYLDPFYTARSSGGAKDLDRVPQGADTSITFFALDTYGTDTDGDITSKYFRPTAYHFFDVSSHMVDPDTKSESGPDYARAWGGRYRFVLHDLGAGPNTFESADSSLTQNYGGSASGPIGDPPIWDYENNPTWAGQFAANTARDANVWLFTRFLGSYLYRPVPADVYLLADNNWQDCYSNPQCSKQGISYTNLPGVYDESYVKKNLGAAIPGATFNTLTGTKGYTLDRHLGCAAQKAEAAPDDSVATGADNTSQSPVLVTDPECVGKKSDPLQEVLELAKARGDTVAGGVNDVAANPNVLRAYVEAHRNAIAPEPAGQFTLTNISVVWPGATTWALPALVGGIAVGTPNGEGWGNLNNVNDRVKTTLSTNCALSSPVAPGCNGVPPISAGGGFSYTIEHESSHFLGLTHPHDYIGVNKDAQGKWDYAYSGFSKYADFAQAPTTYAGAFAPYSVLDQDIIQKGHSGEYLRQAQDYLADAYLQDGMTGRATVSAPTQQKVNATRNWIALGSQLFGCGDYLHSERAMRNASLTAQGVFGPIVAPRNLKAGEKVLFKVDGQTAYDVNGKVLKGCQGKSTASVSKTHSSGFSLPMLPDNTLPAVFGLLVALAAGAAVKLRVRGPRGLRLA